MNEEVTFRERIEMHIKDMWGSNKASVSIHSEVITFLNGLKRCELITMDEYEQFMSYNDLQRGIFHDECIISKIVGYTTIHDLYNMYNLLDTDTGRGNFLLKVLSLIKK